MGKKKLGIGTFHEHQGYQLRSFMILQVERFFSMAEKDKTNHKASTNHEWLGGVITKHHPSPRGIPIFGEAQAWGMVTMAYYGIGWIPH